MLLFNNILLFSVFIVNNVNFFTKTIYANNNKNTLQLDYKNPIYNLDFKNKIKFLLNKKTKVYIHLEQLIPYTNIYHIGISFRSIFKTIRYDLRWIDLPLINETTTNSYTFFWDHSDYKISEIIDYENDLDYNYVLGIYDCRHYVRNLTTWSCYNPTPIWKLIDYIN